MNLLWDSATSPSRLLATGSDKIVYGLGPLYSVNGATVTTYARDGQKSVRAELNGSTVNASWRYRAYGDVVQSNGASTPSILGYAGQLLDPSGLYYMRARWYDAANARFLSRDPASPNVTSPAAINAFGYAAGNPGIYSDPSGLDPFLEEDGVGGGLMAIPSAEEEAAGFRAIWQRLMRLFGRETKSGRAEIVDNTAADAESRAAIGDFPPNRGFLSEPQVRTLEPGNVIDRFGPEGGRFAAPEGTAIDARSLRPGTETGPYFRYEVLKPVDVQAGLTRPWYGQPGMGMQYELPGTVDELLRTGVLRRL